MADTVTQPTTKIYGAPAGYDIAPGAKNSGTYNYSSSGGSGGSLNQISPDIITPAVPAAAVPSSANASITSANLNAPKITVPSAPTISDTATLGQTVGQNYKDQMIKIDQQKVDDTTNMVTRLFGNEPSGVETLGKLINDSGMKESAWPD
jgi:hypothetical protein